MFCSDVNRNSCDHYSNILHEKEALLSRCLTKVKEIDRIKIEKYDNEKLQAKLKIGKLLREFIEQLNEKLELLMTVMQDLSRQSIQSQCVSASFEEILKLLKTALEHADWENLKIELKVNDEVQRLRDNFLCRWKELDSVRKQFEETQLKFQDSCKIQSQLAADLKEKNFEYKRTLCSIKLLRESMDSDDLSQRVTMEMFDELRRNETKFSNSLTAAESTVKCLQKKVCQIECEIKIVRGLNLSKLNVSKLHNEWSVEQLLARQQQLEKLKEQSLKSSDGDDEAICAMKLEISLIERDVNEAHETIKNLQCLASEAASKL